MSRPQNIESLRSLAEQIVWAAGEYGMGDTLAGATAFVGFDSDKEHFTNYFYCDTVADDVQIQAAVDYVIANGGGDMVMLAGNYALSAGVVLPDQQNLYLIIRGAGYKTHQPTQLTVGGDFWAFSLTRTAGFSNDLLFEGFSIIAAVAGTGKGIFLSAPTNFYRVNLQGMRFENLEHALHGNANAAGSWSNAHINDCHFYGCGEVSSTTPAVTIEDASLVRFENCDWTGPNEYQLLYCYQGADVRAHHCRFEGDATTGTSDLVRVESVYNAHFDSCVFQYVRTSSAALTIMFSTGQHVTDCVFDYIVSGATNTHGVWLPNLIYDFQIIGNHFDSANFTYGIRSDHAASTGKVWHNDFDPGITNIVSLEDNIETPFIFTGVVDPLTTLGDHPVVTMADGVTTNVYDRVYLPLGFHDLVSAHVVCVQTTTAGPPDMRWQINTDWGKICSENYNAGSDNTGPIDSAIIQNQLACFNILAALTGVAAGDLIGFDFARIGGHANDTVNASVYYMGIRLRYV